MTSQPTTEPPGPLAICDDAAWQVMKQWMDAHAHGTPGAAVHSLLRALAKEGYIVRKYPSGGVGDGSHS